MNKKRGICPILYSVYVVNIRYAFISSNMDATRTPFRGGWFISPGNHWDRSYSVILNTVFFRVYHYKKLVKERIADVIKCIVCYDWAYASFLGHSKRNNG